MRGDWSKSDISALQDALDRMTDRVGGDPRILRGLMWNTRTLTRVRIDGGDQAAITDWQSGDIAFYNGTFNIDYQWSLFVIVHEFGHSIDAWNGMPGYAQGTKTAMTFLFMSPNPLRCSVSNNCGGSYWLDNPAEDWATSFAAYVLPNSPWIQRIYNSSQLANRQAFAGLEINMMLDALFQIAPEIFPHDQIPPPPYPGG